MSNFTSKIKFLKKTRDKQVRKLSKLLKLLVATEWDMVTKSYEQNANVGLLASKSVADSSKNVQTAISQLMKADFSEIEKMMITQLKHKIFNNLKKLNE